MGMPKYGEKKNYWCEMVVMHPYLALKRFVVQCGSGCVCTCMYCMCVYVCVYTSVGLCAHFCNIRDGVTKSWRWAECIVSVCKSDYLEIMCMCMCVCVCDWMAQAAAEPQQSTNRSRPLFVLSLAINWGNQTSERKREVLIIMLYNVKPTWPCLLDYAVWLMTAAAGAVSQAF